MKRNIKNIKAYTLLSMLVTMVLVTGCSKDFLETDPLSFYEPAATFSTESGMRAALAMCDRNLKLYYARNDNENIPLPTEYLFSDLGAASATDKTSMLSNPAEDLTPSSEKNESNLDRTNSILYFWVQGYKAIMWANTIIQYAPKVEELDEKIKNEYVGRAYFHRSWIYLNLLMQFGDLPFVTKVIEVPKQNYKSTKRDAILDKLILDMQKAVEWVPEQADMKAIGSPNKGACKVLLAKLYLTRGEYKKAKDICDDLIDGGKYALLQGDKFGDFVPGGAPETWKVTRNLIWDMHRAENKLRSDNTEIIMGIPNRGSDKESFVNMLTMRILYPFFFNGGLTDVDGKQALQNYKRNDSRYDPQYDYMRALGRGVATYRTCYWYTHGLWAVNNQMDKGDLRHSVTHGNWMCMDSLRVNNVNSKHYGEYLRLRNDEGKLLCNDTIRRWFDVPHYKLWLDDPVAEANITGSDGDRGARTGSIADWYLYRLAEVYLLRAEAKFYLNPSDPTIADDLNIIRKRAKCEQLYSGTCTIGDIMNERARELYFEEWRNVELTRVSLCLARSGRPDEWGNTYDINTFDKQSGVDRKGGSYWYQRCIQYGIYNKEGRLSIVATNANPLYQMDKKNIYWPIPEVAITGNSKGELHQNYGYTGYDENCSEWETWEEAVADEEKAD
jgi:hypothetical protein